MRCWAWQPRMCCTRKYRLPLIEGGDEVFELAQDLGAQAVYISGAGPTIMAVVHKDDTEFFTRAEAALQRRARCSILPCIVCWLTMSAQW